MRGTDVRNRKDKPKNKEGKELYRKGREGQMERVGEIRMEMKI